MEAFRRDAGMSSHSSVGSIALRKLPVVRVQAEMDLGALQHNFARVREAAPASRVMAVIKAGGYGHGAVRVARALHDAHAFAVARIPEALGLREAGIRTPVVVLSAGATEEEIEAAARHDLELVVHHWSQIEALESARASRVVRVWAKIDTGMNRLGLPVDGFHEAWNRLSRCPAVGSPLRLMTHLANADDRADPATPDQIECFDSCTSGIEAERSIANSAGVLGWPASHRDWVRPGIMLYGVSPFVGTTGGQDGLRPVMTLRSELIAVKRVPAGAAVGYGGTWRSPEPMSIGVVAVGYGDGYSRHAPHATPVLVNDRRVPLIARVSMDMITVDLRSQPRAQPGDPVVLWGRGLPAEEVADKAGTIAYELVCGIANRVAIVER